MMNKKNERTSLSFTKVTITFLLFCLPSIASADIEDVKAHFSIPDTFDIEYPNDVEPSQELIELGKHLFFDKRLSFNETQSCATCHNPDYGFSDGLKFSLGAKGEAVGRNAPHLYNLAWNQSFFWDGRAASLEEQALGPIQSEGEMNMPLDKLLERLSENSTYYAMFEKSFGDREITKQRIAEAIAAYERTIIVDNTPFDQYLRGDEDAISPAAKRGMELFAGKGSCINCHDGPNFTDNSYHNIGVAGADVGRAHITNDDNLKGAFKVPGLRNILFSAPYMHDGSLGTLEEVVRFYNRGGDSKDELSDLMKPLNLTESEIRDLVAFLGSINQPLVVARPTQEGISSTEPVAQN